VEQGYSELEMLLLRQSLHGSTTTETVEDGEGQCKQIKTVHSYPHTIALRLFQAHQSTAEAVRAEQDASPDSDQIRAEIQVRIAAMRVRSGGAKAGARARNHEPLAMGRSWPSGRRNAGCAARCAGPSRARGVAA
jgi:hypothetical protein